MVRLLFLTHRYLGIALGMVVSLWCLSGFVMMYVQYPELDDGERLAGLEPLNLAGCCQVPSDVGDLPIERLRVEMMGDRPALRLIDGRQQNVFDLRSGEHLPGFHESQAHTVAASAASRYGLEGQPRLLDLIQQDQWTVYAAYHVHRPLYHFTMDDRAGTQLYVSSTTGEVVQMTNSGQRFWNWMGAVVHWIYPTVLRQHTAVWLQVVIWLTVVSLFLAVVGIYIGLRQYKKRRNGRRSPYRGWALWHHYAGLFFGLLTLTWLTSGLFSVNAFGALEGRSFSTEHQQLRGGVVDFAQASEFVRGLPIERVPDGTVRLEMSVVGGELFVVAADQHAGRVRLDPRTLEPAALPDEFYVRAGSIMRAGVAVAEAGWLTEEDAYYYNHHETRRFPVFRIRYEDGERFYLDDVTGEIAFAADRDRRWLRWVFLALHRGDFSLLVRSRPIWDLMMWPLLLGVTVGALTGTWLGIRRLVRSVACFGTGTRQTRMRQRLDRRRRLPPVTEVVEGTPSVAEGQS